MKGLTAERDDSDHGGRASYRGAVRTGRSVQIGRMPCARFGGDFSRPLVPAPIKSSLDTGCG